MGTPLKVAPGSADQGVGAQVWGPAPHFRGDDFRAIWRPERGDADSVESRARMRRPGGRRAGLGTCPTFPGDDFRCYWRPEGPCGLR